MEANRIEDNASYQSLKKQIEGFELVAKAVKFWGIFGIKNKIISEAIEKLPELRKRIDLLSKGPDIFNNYFAKFGWIAHESMNIEIMGNAINLAENGKFEAAEERLIAYYSSNEISFLLNRLHGTEEFRIRLPLLNLAYRDTLAGRYHSVVPILLMMIDGAVNDINKNKGFFAENTNLTAWDSIAAHSTGLAQLQKIFNVGRPSTIEEEIDNPYRNGILHGRDLGYANQKVTAKSWAALFAVNDWARSLADGKGIQPTPTYKASFIDEFEKLRQNSNKLSENRRKLEKINNWRKREMRTGINFPETGNPSQYNNFTPEQEVSKFIEYWIKRNYGSIGKQIHNFHAQHPADKKNAGKARKILKDKLLKNYRIISITDIAPIISEVTAELVIEEKSRLYSINAVFRLIYESFDDKIVTFGDEGGQWKIFDGVLEYIANPY